MRSVFRNVTIAFCVCVPIGAASAATIEISGAPLGGNVNLGQNDVVNYIPSGIFDRTNGAAWKQGGSVSSTVASYNIDWFFNGAESGDTEVFSSMSLSFAEDNQNNDLNPGDSPGWRYLGTTSGSGIGPLSFSVADETTGGTVVNGVNNVVPTPGVASLIFSYAKPLYQKFRDGAFELVGWKLTLKPSDWFVFAFDDPGGTDADYDDYVGVGHVRMASISTVPVPSSLILFLAALAYGACTMKLRRRAL
jgi:hypothetical protein